MKKCLLFAAAIAATTAVTAQVETSKIAASTGGSFGSPGNYVKLYIGNADLSDVHVADSALGDFSNAVVQDGALVYCHVGRGGGHPEGSDQILVYNAAAQSREFDVISGVSGLQDMAVYDDFLVFIRGFGATDNKSVKVLNKHTNVEVFADSQLVNPGAMHVAGGKLYVANTQNDASVLTVYDLDGITPQKEGEIILDDTLTSGANGLFIHNQTAYLIHRKFDANFATAYDGFTQVNLADSSFTVDTAVSVNEFIIVHDDKLWMRKNGITYYDFNSSTFSHVTSTANTAAAFDTINEIFYLQNTDFFSLGEINKLDRNFDVDVTAQTDWSGTALSPVYNRFPVIDNLNQTPAGNLYTYTFSLSDVDRGDTARITDAQLTNAELTVQSFDDSTVVLSGLEGSYDNDTLTVTVCDGFGACITETVFIPGQINSVAELPGSNIKMYPNPATDVLFVDGLNQNTPYRLIDLSGKVIREGYVQNQINVSEIKRGMYILHIAGSAPQKVLIK